MEQKRFEQIALSLMAFSFADVDKYSQLTPVEKECLAEPEFKALQKLMFTHCKKKQGDTMGDKSKKDKGKREEQKKDKHTLKEKRNQKKDKNKSILEDGR